MHLVMLNLSQDAGSWLEGFPGTKYEFTPRHHWSSSPDFWGFSCLQTLKVYALPSSICLMTPMLEKV